MVNIEGQENEHVLDAAKLTCPYCGGPEVMLTSLMDDPNDITEETVFAAYDITITGGHFHGLVGLCAQCGHEWVPLWYFFDVSATTGASLVMTNLDAGTINTLAGIYAIPMTGTDVGDYFKIATHTAADPTTITLDAAASGDEDGIWMFTNILPLGLTANTA